MAELYVFDFSGGGEARAEREAERAAERARLRDRYLSHVVDRVPVDRREVERVLDVLLDFTDRFGKHCECSCHPRLSAFHGDGLDCPCSWDEARGTEQPRELAAVRHSHRARAIREAHVADEQAIATWLAGQPGVEAERTSSFAPEQWRGTVDGHTFSFRARHGEWRLEIDLRPSGRFANRVIEGRDGEIHIEPVELDEGDVIAQGLDSDLGDTAVEHLQFIVRTIREHASAQGCGHDGALLFCPTCGTRM